MTAARSDTRLSEVSGEYDALLCDVWGVVRDGERVLPEAVDALKRFRDTGRPVLLLSNSPRREASLLRLLDDMGADPSAFDGAATSGDCTRDMLEALAPGPAYKLGPDWDDAIYEGLGLEFAPLDEARFVSCTGLRDYRRETPDQYRDLLTEAKLRGLPLVCANPDIVVQGPGGSTLYCAGALAQFYEELGGQAMYAGKPHPPIYDLAYRRLETLLGEPVDKSRVLAIGDGPATDLAGARSEGLDALFISGGIHGGADAEPAEILKAEDASARYAARALVW